MLENPGEQIKKIRTEKGLSQDRFGRKIGVSGKTISAYETGRIHPPLKVLDKISQTYSTTIQIPNIKTKEMLLEKLEQIQLQMETMKDTLKNSELQE